MMDVTKISVDSDALMQLVYVSIPADDVNAEMLEGILDEARSFNAAKEITGVLLYTQTCFAQCLEGSWGVLQELYGRIQRDARHRDVHLLHYMPITDRSYRAWDMGCTQISRSDMVSLRIATWGNDDPINTTDHPSPGSVIMQSIWQTHQEEQSAHSS